MLKKHPFSSEDAEYLELSKAAFWKTIGIGIVVGTLSFFVASALGSNIMAWFAIDILAVVGAGFITGRVTRLIGMGFAMGFLAGLTFYTVAILRYFTEENINWQDPSNIIAIVILVLAGGVSGLLGAWLGTIGRPHSFF